LFKEETKEAGFGFGDRGGEVAWFTES
jgi:hypothetical protein